MKTTLLFLFLFLLHSCNFNKKTTNDENSTYIEETVSNEYEQIEEESNTEEESSIEIIEYKAIDLGLPSGTLWANKNIGAKGIYQEGDYFAWGETSPKYDYSWGSYKFGNKKLHKYCPCGTKCSYCVDCASCDDKKILEYIDDAATINMGEEWCMPTIEQFKELILECQHVPSWNGGPSGRLGGVDLIGPNGNMIHLSAAGYYYGSELENISIGKYWSNCIDKDNPMSAIALKFEKEGRDGIDLYISYGGRFEGFPIRAVKRKKTTNNSETSKIGYKAIDLGLPSGTLWADRNVGAKSVIDDLGHKFAWGETEQKEEYNYENYKFRDYSQHTTVYAVTKYSNYGENIINKNEFEAIDDAATVNMGESWCTPTIEQIKELINNCTIEFSVGGYKFIGPNGNFIYFNEDASKKDIDVDSKYIYWSSSLTNEDIFAHCFTFNGDFGKLQIQQKMRYEGGYIRAVKK